MEKKYCKIIVPESTYIVSSSGDYCVADVVDDALRYLERGSSWAALLPEAVEVLKTWPAERLQAFIHLRTAQGFDGDVRILEKVLKEKSKSKKV